jgi:SAM-dependent methyltransferase
MEINENIVHLDDRVQWEFKCIEKFLIGNGVDVGCGTNRLSMEVLSVDQQPNRQFAHADIVHDCKDLDIPEPYTFGENEYTFKENTLDFIFSSHCIEDFDNIEEVFKNWWSKIKPDGYMILLLPDMEKCDCEICKSEAVQEYRKKAGMSARYWTIEDYDQTGKGNPSHRTNVGKKYMHSLLSKIGVNYEIAQVDTLPHDKTCTVDFVIKKIGE